LCTDSAPCQYTKGALDFKYYSIAFSTLPGVAGGLALELSGKLKGLWVLSLDDNYRVFEFLNQDKVLLIEFGIHDEMY
jgi:hypothetical protein